MTDIYHKINGDFANGWKYNNGDIIKSVQSNHNIDISTKSEMVCDDYLLEVSYEDCTDWWVFSGDEMVNSWTSCGEHSEYVLIYEECPSESSPGGGASGGGGYEPDPDPFVGPPIIDADDLLREPKADCIYQRLTQTSIMSRYLKNFDGEFPVSHLKYELSTQLLPNQAGSTDPNPNDLGDYWMKIKINENTLALRPTLAVANTFIHETVHAEIFRKIKSLGDSPSVNNFPGIFDYYARYKNDSNENWSHQMMAEHYVDIMAEALREFDPSYSSEVYNALAWSGLMGTVAWNNKSTMEQESIIETKLQFNHNGSKNCN